MAAFTMQLQEVLDSEGDPGDGLLIGLNDYPIPSYWTQADRVALNRKIIGHYVMREIAYETVGLFRHFIRQRMWEIMPPYIQLYESTKLAFDPISSVKLNTTRDETMTENKETDTNGTSESTAHSESRSVSSNMPSTMLSGNGNYADTGADAFGDQNGSGTNTGTSKTTGTDTGNVISTTGGYQGSPSDLLAKYRATILNVDMMIVSDLFQCFFLLWDNLEEMLPPRGILY